MPQVLVPVEARVSPSAPDPSSASAAAGGPRQQWMDVTFADAPVGITHVSFFNYYCAAITISHTTMALGGIDGRLSKQAEQMGMRPAWTVVVPKLTLMADPHCEDDAQNYHELTTVHFAPGFDHRRVTRLRICCLQPSPSWREYGLRELRFYRTEASPTLPLQPTPNLTAAQREVAATMLEQIVGLAEIASDIRKTLSSARAGRASASPAAGGNDRARGKAAPGGSGPASSGGGGGAASGRINTPPRASGPDTPSRRLPPDHPSVSSLAPYVIGEWNDELRLTGMDSARPYVSKPPSEVGLGVGGGGLYGGLGGTSGTSTVLAGNAAAGLAAMTAELTLDG